MSDILTGLGIFFCFIGLIALAIAAKFANLKRLREQGEDDVWGYGGDSSMTDPPPSPFAHLFVRRRANDDEDSDAHPHIIAWDTALQMLKDAHHIGVLGATGDGKTTTGEALLRLLPGECIVIDPNWEPGKWGSVPVSTVDDMGVWGPIANTLQRIDTEISRRRIAVREGAGDAARTPLIILWDEPNEAIEELGAIAGAKLRRWLRGARQFGVKLILFPQSDRVEALGLSRHGDARRNLLWMYLGDDARRLVAREVKAKRLGSETHDAVMQMQRPGVLRYHEEIYITNMAAIAHIIKTPVPVGKVWGDTPPPRPERAAVIESMPQIVVSGVDDLDLFTVLARLADEDVIKSETRMLEAAFQCTAGGGKIYQTAARRLRSAKEQLQEVNHAGHQGHHIDEERTDRAGGDPGDQWQLHDIVGHSESP